MVKVHLGERVTALSMLVVLGVRRDGHKILLAMKTMGGASVAMVCMRSSL